jgi:prefoldin beta subunit
MKELSPQLQNQILQLQQLEQHARSIALQKSQVEALLRETETAISELEKVGSEEIIYKTVGEIMIKTKKDEILASLAEKKETYSLRIKTLERQEERILRRAQELQTQVQTALREKAG